MKMSLFLYSDILGQESHGLRVLNFKKQPDSTAALRSQARNRLRCPCYTLRDADSRGEKLRCAGVSCSSGYITVHYNL